MKSSLNAIMSVDGILPYEVVELVEKPELYYELEVILRSGKQYYEQDPIHRSEKREKYGVAVFYNRNYYIFNLTFGIISNVVFYPPELEIAINDTWYNDTSQIVGTFVKLGDKLKLKDKAFKGKSYMISCRLQLKIPIIH